MDFDLLVDLSRICLDRKQQQDCFLPGKYCKKLLGTIVDVKVNDVDLGERRTNTRDATGELDQMTWRKYGQQDEKPLSALQVEPFAANVQNQEHPELVVWVVSFAIAALLVWQVSVQQVRAFLAEFLECPLTLFGVFNVFSRSNRLR